MIFWIEKAFKDEYLNSANSDGLRCKFPINFDAQTKTSVSGFISFIREKYYFPIRLSVESFDKTHFVNAIDSHKYYGIFYDGDAQKNIYPKIHIASRLAKSNPLEDVLFSIAHEITHYYQWYFMEDTERTDRSLEIEANKWAKYILRNYLATQNR